MLGVGEQVGEHLDDLVAVELGDGVVEMVDDLDGDAVGHRERAQDLGHKVGDVGGLAHHAALAGEVEQAGDDLLAAVGLVDDELDVG